MLVENSRPGTLERLGSGPDVLLARNDALVITRVTGFGQDGPYASRPGFATIAEAMSGLAVAQRRARRPAAAPADRAHRRGHRPGGGVRHDGRAAFRRRAGGRRQPAGDDVPADGSARLALRGAAANSSRGSVPDCPTRVPRGTYRCSDGRWVALSTSSESVARTGDGACSASATTSASATSPAVPSTATSSKRSWPSGVPRDAGRGARHPSPRPRPRSGPVMDMADIAVDPHYLAREHDHVASTARRCRA